MRKEAPLYLVVDDEPDTCWAFEHMLRKCGARSASAISGVEALRLMELHRFQSVILDAKLPDVDGLELAKRIRRMNPDVRIIMVSGYFIKDDAEIQKALAEGLIRRFISKPFQHDEILRALEIQSPENGVPSDRETNSME